MAKLGMKNPNKKNRYQFNIKISLFDDKFSEFIRKRAITRAGGCERCGSQKYDIEKEDGSIFPAWKQLQCSHIIGRNNRKVRWDESNAFGLCAGCHMYLEHHPFEHDNFALDKLGDIEYQLLIARSYARGKPDKNALYLYYTEKIKEL